MMSRIFDNLYKYNIVHDDEYYTNYYRDEYL